MSISLPPIRDVIRRHGLDAKKKFGQHFLLDGNLTDRIVREAGHLSGRHVIEIGPGPGGLTRSLLAAEPASLTAVERDPRCVEALLELKDVFPTPFELIEADALEVKLDDLAPAPRVIVANLPYNVGTALLINWLHQRDGLEKMVLMFQREVAERIAAPPATGAYGRLAVLTQWLCETRILFNIDARAFTPPPKVQSAVIEIIPRTEPLFEADLKKLERVTQAAFGQRRKMLRGSLKSLGIKPEDADIDPQKRAEELDVEAFCRLARLL